MIIRKTIQGIALLFILVAGVNGQGMQDSVFHIRQVEVTAGRIFEKEVAGVKETRVDTTVLQEKVNRSVSDILSENTTVYIKNYGRGALATASFRGTAPTHTRVSWNGLPINSPMLGMVDFSLIPVYIVDELSLQHGAASVKEQSGGLGGHIRINSTVDWSNRFSGRYYQGVGSFTTLDEFGQVNVGNGTVQSKTRLYHSYSANDYPFVNKNIVRQDGADGPVVHPTQRNRNAGYRKYGWQQELYLRPMPRLHTSVRLWYQDASRGIPSVLSYEGDDSTTMRRNEQFDRTWKGVADATWYGDRLKARLLSGVDYQQLDYVMQVRIGGTPEVQKPVNSGSDMQSWYNTLRLDYDLSERISFRLSGEANRYAITTLDSANHTGYDETRMEYSLFGGAYAEAGERVHLSAGWRKDLLPRTETPFIYTLGISLKPFDEHELVIKSGFVRNFHHPALNDLYWQPGGNPDLLPEEGHTLDGGVHYTIKEKGWNLESELTGYYSDIHNWILWLPSVKGYWEAQNLGRVRSYGLEYNLKAGLSLGESRLQLNGTYAWTRSVNREAPIGNHDASVGSQLPFIPRHSGNVLVSFRHRGYHLSYQYQSYGKRNLLSSNFETPGDSYPYYRLYALHMNHLSAGKSFSIGRVSLHAGFKVRNLFNEVYRNVLNRFMPPRHYMLMLKIDF